MGALSIRALVLLTPLFFGGIAGLSAQEKHQVQSNQTLYAISRLYGVTVQDLLNWNQLKGTAIRVGQNLIVSDPAAKAETAVIVEKNAVLAQNQYAIQTGDTLSEIALKYGTSVEELKRLNGFSTESVRVGQRIFIRQPVGVTVYKVQPGDSLSVIASRFQIPAADLMSINQLPGPQLTAGQTLRVFRPKEVPLTHEVLEMDTLPGLSALYGLAPQEIKALNGLKDDFLKPGAVLRLREYAAAGTPAVFARQSAPAAETEKAPIQENTYTVASGDTLYKLARLFGVAVKDLVEWNKLPRTQISVGQKLVIRQLSGDSSAGLSKPASAISFPEEEKKPQISESAPSVLPSFDEKDREKLSWDSLVVLDKGIPLYEWNNDYYYWTHPGEVSQPNRGYYENDWNSPLEAFKKARKLWEAFGSLVEKRPLKSRLLEGYTFVLDPGHGGLDPGAIVKTTDGTGDTLYVTEDEYVYDIALRMYVLLKEHGARVEMTILSPNHLIRDTTPATRTLIHEKNEVYNDLALNEADKADNWIAGGPRGLEKRVEAAGRFLRNAAEGKRVFISLHSDNNPFMPMGTGVLSFEKDSKTDGKSKALAESLVPFLGKGAYARTEDLGVLRSNPADYKILVETRNVAFPEHSWALRFANTRQLDAQKIVRGILEFFKKKG